MADSTTTGSAIVGMVHGGLQKGMGMVASMSAGTEFTDKILLVYGDPDEVITSTVGSQIAFDIENNDIYMTDLKGGSEWSRLAIAS